VTADSVQAGRYNFNTKLNTRVFSNTKVVFYMYYMYFLAHHKTHKYNIKMYQIGY